MVSILVNNHWLDDRIINYSIKLLEIEFKNDYSGFVDTILLYNNLDVKKNKQI